MNFITKFRTLLVLGLLSVAHVAIYRLSIHLGLNPVLRLRGKVPVGQFFLPPQTKACKLPAVSSWQDNARLFGHWPIEITNNPPDWLTNPMTRQRMPQPERPWWKIPDFDPSVGDIKLIWELSRMDWVLAFAQRAANGDKEALERLNNWLADWCIQNPPYMGPNWKCGQEASIRVMNLAISALLLGQVQQPTAGLRNLVFIHLQRIAPTIQYAIAQDNNHATSEAAALFIGGSWLAKLGVTIGNKWEHTGRYWLEKLAIKLIGKQGSFSQYSLNYHRVMLDTFSTVEIWRCHLNLPEFSKQYNTRLVAATQWLYHIINVDSGDGPNIGANDGARLLQLVDTSYRDYRPSVQLAAALFANTCAYKLLDSANLLLQWLGVVIPTQVWPLPISYIADDGGFAKGSR